MSEYARIIHTDSEVDDKRFLFVISPDEDEMDDMGEEEPGMRYMEGELDQDAVVNEVAKRVSARLQQESKKQEMVDALAERIFNRLANNRTFFARKFFFPERPQNYLDEPFYRD